MGVLVMMLDYNNNNNKNDECDNNIMEESLTNNNDEKLNNNKILVESLGVESLTNNTFKESNNKIDQVDVDVESVDIESLNINEVNKIPCNSNKFILNNTFKDNSKNNNTLSSNNNNGSSKLECPVFHWPQHSFLIEHFRQRQDLLSSELQTKLESLDIFVSGGSPTSNINCKISTAARNCGRLAWNRIWFSFDIFLARNRPGLISDPTTGIRKKRRKRKSKSKKNVTEENETEEEASTVLKTEATLAIVETCETSDGIMRGV